MEEILIELRAIRALLEKRRKPIQKQKEMFHHPLVVIWNNSCGPLPKCIGATGKRLASAEARWAEKCSTEYWSEVITRMTKSDFCLGKIKSESHSHWKADFDFLVKPDTHIKVMEGKYDNRGPNKPTLKSFKDLEDYNAAS